MRDIERITLTLDEYRQLALNPVHEDLPSIFRLEMVEVDELPWRHRQHYPKYSVSTGSIAYTDTLEEAEALMRKEMEKRSEGEWLDVYCFFIQEVPKAMMCYERQYLSKRVYDAKGNLIDRSYCTTDLNFEDEDHDSHHPQEVFRGRTAEHIRFHRGDIVEIFTGNEVSLSIVTAEVPSVEWAHSRGHDMLDESDDSYVVVDGPGYEWHSHVPSLDIFAPHYKVPPYIERRFKSYLEKIEMINRAHDYATRNKAQIEQSQKCGCYCCTRIFPASEVKDYVSKEEPTAICLHCGTDSVIGDASGVPLTKSLLRSMQMSWFGY